MNKNKQFYSAPAAELFVVRFEENIMSPAYGSAGAAGSVMCDNDDYDYSI